MLYTTRMALINVRLDEEDERRARALRAEGVQISTLVRSALRAEYERRVAARLQRRRPSQVVSEVIAAFPDPEPRARDLDVADRRAVRDHIVARLRGAR